MKTLTSVFFILLGISIGLSSCGDGKRSQATPEQASSMKDFGDDESFQEQHELPKEIDYNSIGKMKKLAVEGQDSAQYYFINNEHATATLLVFHEWWGLNDHIKREAARYAEGMGNIRVMALDMYDGKLADNRNDANTYMQESSDDRIRAIIDAALALIPLEHKVATIGWCFGGGWSLKAAIQAGEQLDGCVMYYGMPVRDSASLAPLAAPVLGHFAAYDGWITPEIVEDFEELADALDKTLTTYSYEAEHAFANPSGERYKETAAQSANRKSLKFLKECLAPQSSKG